jgi:hypothetical protein
MFVVQAVFIAMNSSWKMSMLIFAVCSTALFALWIFFGKDFELSHSATATSADGVVVNYGWSHALKEKISYALPFTYSGLLLIYIVVLTIYPQSPNAGGVKATTISAVMAFGGIVGAIVGVIYVKTVAKRVPVIRWSGLAVAVIGTTMFLTHNAALALVASALLGFLIFLPVTALLMIPQERKGMTPRRLTLIMSCFWAFSYIVETVLYLIIGFVIDAASKNMADGAKNYVPGLIIAGVYALACFAGSFLLPETGKRKTVEAPKQSAPVEELVDA